MLKKSNLIEFWQVYKRRRMAVLGLAIVVIFVLAIALAPYIAPYDPSLRTGTSFGAPSWEHLLGTDDIGADILSKLIYAGRVSLMVGFICASLIVMTGSMVGLVSGFLGGIADEVLMRITDIVLTLPRLPLMIVMAAYMGPGMWTIIFVYSVVGWASLARQVRSQVLSVKEFTFVEASRAIGASNTHIIANHILPNVMGIILVNSVMEIMFAILTEAGLSFLGLGDPTNESWGIMLYFAQTRGAFLRGAWWWIFSPGLSIALISCSFNFIGTALNDLFALKLGKR